MTANAIETLSNCVAWSDCYKAYLSLFEYAAQFHVLHCFSMEQTWWTVLHATCSTVMFCISSSCVTWQPLSWSVDWASRTNAMAFASSLCDLFLWGWAKMTAYQSKPRTWREVKQQIRDNFAALPPDFLTKSACVYVSNTLWKCVQNAEVYSKT
jgi:hypothetical protein